MSPIQGRSASLHKTFCVAEVQGCDGPFGFSELVLQKIWLRGDFERNAVRAQDGAAVRILSPGKWNRLGGPDFLGARLLIDGRRVDGDVELHLHERDWEAHGHSKDAAYANVVLHVVLFPPGDAQSTKGVAGRLIPLVTLLPLLPHDLEAFAWDDAAETLAGEGAMDALRTLAGLPPEELHSQVRDRALARWRQKVKLAGRSIKRHGWEFSCHGMALEILGYRQNRAPMLQVSERWPLAAWRVADSDGLVQTITYQGGLRWRNQGVRPLNQPGRRLRQYSLWVAAVPSWPERLRALGPALQGEERWESTTRGFRRQCRLAIERTRWSQWLSGGAVGGARWDTLVCDGFLPFLGALGYAAAERWWMEWVPAEVPDGLFRLLPPLGLAGDRESPSNNGMVQGLLDWWLERECPDWASEVMV